MKVIVRKMAEVSRLGRSTPDVLFTQDFRATFNGIHRRKTNFGTAGAWQPGRTGTLLMNMSEAMRESRAPARGRRIGSVEPFDVPEPPADRGVSVKSTHADVGRTA